MHRLTSLCIRHPRLTLLAALALLAAAGYSALRTDHAVGIDANLGADHPLVQEFDDFLERFGGGYPIVVAFECADPGVCDRAFHPAALEMASAVSHDLEQASFVSRVSSPGTTRLLVPSGDFGLEARQLVVDGRAVEDPDLLGRALADPLWSRTLVSADGRVGAIVIELGSTESDALSTVIREVRRAIAPYGAFNFHVVGEAAMSVAAQEAGLESAIRVGIGTGGMLFLALLILIRSLTAVLASLATIGVASAWTIGLLPLLGWQQSELTNGAATLILVIGCADCVHFAAHYLETRPQFSDNATALEATGRWVLAPCFLTTATTVGSFAAFASGEVLALRQFGVMAAIGIALAFVLTFSLFPALLVLVPARPRRQQHSAAWHEVLDRISQLGTRRKGLVLSLSFVLAVLGITGIPKLRVEMNISELWGPDHPVMRAIDFVSEHLQRADRLEIELTLPPEARLEDPTTLRSLAAIEDELSGLEGMGRSQSLVTILRHSNHLLRPTDDGMAGLPDTEAGVAELLFLVSSGASGALDAWLTLDQRHSRVSLEVQDLSMQERENLLSHVDQRLRTTLPEGWSHAITGPVALASRYGAEFSRSQTNIVSASSLLVFVMIGIYLRSLPWALLAMIPNAIALVLLFGAMGHGGILLNFGSAIVAPIAIGIAADDTIHFLTAYSRERRCGKEPIAALHGAISGVGEAVIATAIALSLGFLSMIASPMASIASLGLVSAIAIVGATLADLLVLPALIAAVATSRRLPALRALSARGADPPPASL
jgi:hypothetical protein